MARWRLCREGRARPRLRPQRGGEDGRVQELHPERSPFREARHPRQLRDPLPLRSGGRRADEQQDPTKRAVPPSDHGRDKQDSLSHVLHRYLRHLRRAHDDDYLGDGRQGLLDRHSGEDRWGTGDLRLHNSWRGEERHARGTDREGVEDLRLVREEDERV